MKTSDFNPVINFITKPLAPPWNDSAKNIPRYIIENSPELDFQIMTPKNQPLDLKNTISQPVYPANISLQLTHSAKIRAFTYLTSQLMKQRKNKSRPALFHYFFTPNPLTSKIISVGRKLSPGTRSIQTITSLPQNHDTFHKLLFTDEIVTVSQFTARTIESKLQRPVHVIYPGVPSPSQPDPQRIADFRQKWNHGNGKLLLYPGDLIYADCKDLILKIVCRLSRQTDTFKLMIVSRTKHAADTPAGKELEQFSDQIQVVQDDEADILTSIAASDIVIFPVRKLYAKMDLPLVLLESMALAKPIVTTSISSLKELNTNNGLFFCHPSKPQDFVDALLQLINHPDVANALAHKARESYLNHFTAAHMARGYQNLYHQMTDLT